MPNATNTNINFGDIEIGTTTEIPTARRVGGRGGSKFPFDKLSAPVEKNGKTTYSNFTVPYKAGDEKKFRRSVQSATTQANRSGKEAGKYFESRSVTKTDGAFGGIVVIRSDNRPAE